MKKAFKKIMTVALVLALVFSFTVKPKKADASVSMTLAGIAATVGGSAMLPYALGAAGILAVGGVISNWDVVKDYGEKVIARMGGYDAATGSYVQNPDGTATVIYSPAMKLAMAQSVDAMGATVPISQTSISLGSFQLYNYSLSNQFEKVVSMDLSSLKVGDKILLTYTTDGSAPVSWSIRKDNTSFAVKGLSSTAGTYTSELLVGTTYLSYLTGNNSMKFSIGSQGSVNLSDVSIKYVRAVAETVSTADTFGTVADNVNARLLGMNAVIADNQAVTISADAELLNASIDDLASISDATLAETQTQTGILSQIWNNLKNLSGTIIAASSAAAASINTNMDQLWDDAGLVWSGMADTLVSTQADVNAKLANLADTTAMGLDNVKIGLTDTMTNLRDGIDSLAATAAANMAAWGQLTLDGIESGVGTISTGLTNVWERVGAIPGAIAAIPGDIVTGLTDLAIPTPAQTAENEENMQTTKQLFLSKFDFITVPIEQIKSLYAQRKSLHDLTVNIMGQTVYILPLQFAGVVSGFRPIASGAAVVGTIIFIYRRVQPGDVI